MFQQGTAEAAEEVEAEVVNEAEVRLPIVISPLAREFNLSDIKIEWETRVIISLPLFDRKLSRRGVVSVVV